jgi:hypothetical protein
VTLSVIALTGHGPGAPSLGRSEGVTFLLSVLTRHRIDDDHDVHDTIEARHHAQA